MTDYFGRPDIVSVPLRGEQVDLTAVWIPDSVSSALIKDFVECFAEAINHA